MISTDQLEQVPGAAVYDTAGEKVGKAGSVYLDDSTGDPTWVTVKTGLFGNNESFAPLNGANFNGDRLDVAYAKEQIQGAPNLPTDGHLEPAQERDLYRHYFTQADAGSDLSNASGPGGHDSADPNDSSDAAQRGSHDDNPDSRAERLDDDHQADADTSPGPPSIRLRKYVVTETHTVTVPVERGEVRVVPAAADDEEDVR